MSDFKNLKIELKSENEARKVQEKLFELGYSWGISRDIRTFDRYPWFIFSYETGDLFFEVGSSSEEYFPNHPNTLITVDELLGEKPMTNESSIVTADKILLSAANTLKERGKTYDKSGNEKERSMSKIVEAFRTITGVDMTTEQGWLFMAVLKAVRSQQGNHSPDSYLDGAAYFALAGEEADLNNRQLTLDGLSDEN